MKARDCKPCSVTVDQLQQYLKETRIGSFKSSYMGWKKPYKVKEYCVIAGLQPYCVYQVFENNYTNCYRSLVERVFSVPCEPGQGLLGDKLNFTVPPQPLDRAFKDELKHERSMILKNLNSYCCSLAPLSVDDFVATCAQSKRKQYRLAAQKMNGRRAVRRDFHIKMFVKTEKTENYLKVDPVPRAVQPRSIQAHVEIGRFIRPLEHAIYNAIDTMFGSPTIMKGLNADQVGAIVHKKWAKFKNPCSIGIDAARFDQTVSVQALKWSHSIYKECYKGDDKTYLTEMLGYLIDNEGTAYTNDGYKIKYSVRGCRMSGDMDTALGNCLIMGSMCHWIKRKYGFDIEVLNNGDDCHLIFEREDIERISRLIITSGETFGFNLKVENPVFLIEHIDFCQQRPVLIGETYRMIRDPYVATCKDTIMIIKPKDNKSLDLWRNTVSAGGLALNDKTPVMPQFYRALGRNTTTKKVAPHFAKVEETGFWRLGKGMINTNGNVSDETRLSYWRAFGMTYDQQVEVENLYDNCEYVPIGAPSESAPKQEFPTFPFPIKNAI